MNTNSQTDDQYQDSEFGNCPICNSQGVVLNIGRNHYAVCDTHQTYWFIGSNLFSAWRDESEETWERNRQKVTGCRKTWHHIAEQVISGEFKGADAQLLATLRAGLDGMCFTRISKICQAFNSLNGLEDDDVQF